MSKKSPLTWFMIIGLLVVIIIPAYWLPPIHDRLSWRLDNLRAKIIYTFNPPEQNVFIPQEEAPVSADNVIPTLLPPTVAPVNTEIPLPTQPPQATIAPTVSSTPVFTPTPIPSEVSLQGAIHEYQKWNNCGPANLSMMLSYWGWQGDQFDTASVLKPNPRDNNVMMSEMRDYVNNNTNLKAILRVGGNLELLKRSLAAGFPVMVEKGIVHNKEWMGHYQALTGYNDSKKQFIAQDSLITPDLPVPYEQLSTEWRVFDYMYLIIYPPEREAEIRSIVGVDWDEKTSLQSALKKAQEDTQSLSGRDLAFAWFNVGTNEVGLKEYEAAATAFDKYFVLYSSLPKDQRPWRMIWYQNGPYEAYYYTARYRDVITLASITLGALTEKLLEEACYWRALAKEQTDDLQGALTDLDEAIRRNPNYLPAQKERERLSAIPSPTP